MLNKILVASIPYILSAIATAAVYVLARVLHPDDPALFIALVACLNTFLQTNH